MSLVDFAIRLAFLAAGLGAGAVIVDAGIRGARAWRALRCQREHELETAFLEELGLDA